MHNCPLVCFTRDHTGIEVNLSNLSSWKMTSKGMADFLPEQAHLVRHPKTFWPFQDSSLPV